METIKRPQFGNRELKPEDNVFNENAWDNVQWDSEQEENAKASVNKNSANFVDEVHALELEAEASNLWDTFYNQHENRFFKDRNWIFTEFPELRPPQEETDISKSSLTVLEVGCGVGNTVFPLLEAHKAGSLLVYCCDFSEKAVQLVKDHKSFNPKYCCPFVWDITKPLEHTKLNTDSDQQEHRLLEDSLDAVLLIFVLSAINPKLMDMAVKNLVRLLKPGGVLLFRDYGRYDMAQLRFKPGKCLSENFYVRGDSTRVYFFEETELEKMFKEAGLEKLLTHVDRRLLVNRGKRLKMYRVWIQCRYRKKH